MIRRTQPRTSLRPFTPKHQTAVREACHAINIWEGAVRSAKTVGTFVAWPRYIMNAPPGDLVMIGRTERTLIRNVIRPLQRIYGAKRIRLNRGNGEAIMFGRLVYLVGANDERAADKIQGMTLAGGYGDEITIWPESLWDMLLTRFSVEGARFFGTTNPNNPNHWLLDKLDKPVVWLRHDGTLEYFDDQERVDLDVARFSFRLEDNPTLPADYMRRIKASFSGLFYNRYIEGLWVLSEGLVFEAFNADRHVIDKLPANEDVIEWVLAVDYGTSNPFVALLIGVTDRNRLWVAREWRWSGRERQHQLTDAEYSTRLRDWLNTEVARDLPAARTPGRVIVDPSAASFIAQLWRDQWPGIRQADNTVLDGIRSTSSLFALDRIVVDPSCTGLIRELGIYSWDEKAAKERGVDQPLKTEDHGPDALRYGIMDLRVWWRHWLTTDHEAAA